MHFLYCFARNQDDFKDKLKGLEKNLLGLLMHSLGVNTTCEDKGKSYLQNSCFVDFQHWFYLATTHNIDLDSMISCGKRQ